MSCSVATTCPRSVGGSYDNEGVAIFALIFTFYLWVKAVHTGSMMWACFCALSYYYMVAAWGGYVFIINIIPIFTVIMIVGGRYSSRLYIAYSVFYSLGSLMAMTVPFVGFNVVNQAECAASHGVFAAIQVYAFVSYLYSIMDAKVVRSLFTTLALILVGGLAFGLISLQLLGKIQWTGRSLTLLDPTYASKYIPIIASVSEHQPTTWTSFFFDLHILVPLAPVGLFTLFGEISDGGIFVILYGTLAWYFAGVMVRLMLTLGAHRVRAGRNRTVLYHDSIFRAAQDLLTCHWCTPSQEQHHSFPSAVPYGAGWVRSTTGDVQLPRHIRVVHGVFLAFHRD